MLNGVQTLVQTAALERFFSPSVTLPVYCFLLERLQSFEMLSTNAHGCSSSLLPIPWLLNHLACVKECLQSAGLIKRF